MNQHISTTKVPHFKTPTERAIFELLQDSVIRDAATIRSKTGLNCTGALNRMRQAKVVEQVAHVVSGHATSGYRLAEQYRPEAVANG